MKLYYSPGACSLAPHIALQEIGVPYTTAILQYIADRKPGELAPAFGTLERYRLMECLNFIATEVHKQFGPLWYPTTPEATKEEQRKKLAKRFDEISTALANKPYLTGEKFTIADAYLFTVVNWA